MVLDVTGTEWRQPGRCAWPHLPIRPGSTGAFCRPTPPAPLITPPLGWCNSGFPFPFPFPFLSSFRFLLMVRNNLAWATAFQLLWQSKAQNPLPTKVIIFKDPKRTNRKKGVIRWRATLTNAAKKLSSKTLHLIKSAITLRLFVKISP